MPGRSVSSGNSTSATPFWGLAWTAARFGSLMSSGGRSSAGNGLIDLLLSRPRALGRGAPDGSSNSRAARIPVDVDVAADTCGGAAGIPDLIGEFHRADMDRIGSEWGRARGRPGQHMTHGESDVRCPSTGGPEGAAGRLVERDDAGVLKIEESH